MNDYIAGYMGAAGVIAALRRRRREGGSYHVRVHLVRCSTWFRSLGQFTDADFERRGPENQLVAPEVIRGRTPYGKLERLAPLVKLSRTPVHRPRRRPTGLGGMSGAKKMAAPRRGVYRAPMVISWPGAWPIALLNQAAPIYFNVSALPA
jgi:hypothetical protein